MKKGGGSFPFALEEGVRGAGFAVFPEEDLGASHLTCEHAGFSLEFAVRGIEGPISLWKAGSNGTFCVFSAFFIEINPAAVAPVGLTEFPSIDRAIGTIKEKFNFAGFALTGAEGELALDVAVGAGPENLGRNKGGFVIIPDGIAGRLVGWIGKLICLINRAADGFGGLKALQNCVDDQADFRLGAGQ
jgi:hypothetical protein